MKPRVIRKDSSVNVFVCNGDLDAPHMTRISHKVSRLMHRRHINVLLDLRKARFVDLASLGILVDRLRKIRQREGDIRLCNLRPRVSETLRLVGLNGLIQSFGTREEALESFHFA
ncbi:MAG: STAS domain-containing protein [Candidatus Omnitrophica bacterium]|nr:STAS domain-containing protein [Candidatus Omnitrophota bacterium]